MQRYIFFTKKHHKSSFIHLETIKKKQIAHKNEEFMNRLNIKTKIISYRSASYIFQCRNRPSCNTGTQLADNFPPQTKPHSQKCVHLQKNSRTTVNDTTVMNIAVLLAGGSGRRMGQPEPKQFIVLAGCTILEHSIRAFHNHPGIDEIVIISHADYLGRVEAIARPYPKVRHILPGGKERYDSSLAAIRAYEKRAAEAAGSVRLLIHDAVRPLVSERIISDCLKALRHYDAVDVAIPTTDTIVEVDAQGRIARIPPRASLRNVQTPQAFRLETIAEAYRRGLQDPDFITTDDCGVVHRYLPEAPIFVVAGDITNIKLTYREDLLLAEKLLGK